MMAPVLRLLLAAGSLAAVAAHEAPAVTDIHVVFSNHLDVGFNERSWNMSPSERCDGLFSPDGARCMPLAANVTSEYFNVYGPAQSHNPGPPRPDCTLTPQHTELIMTPPHRNTTN